MTEINTEFLQRCIDTLEKSYVMLQKTEDLSDAKKVKEVIDNA